MKRFLSLFLTLILLLSFTGCDNPDEEFKGQFYTLKEAYEMGLLTHDDLVQIAEYHNTPNNPSESLDINTVRRLEAAWAKTVNESGRHSYLFPGGFKAEEITIDIYDGTYNGVIVVEFQILPLQLPAITGGTLIIDGVAFKLNTVVSIENFVVWSGE